MAAPPTFPNQPPATDPDPAISGVTIVSSHNNGEVNSWRFKINVGEEPAAIAALIASLDTAIEFSLSDHSRGDFESVATYRKDGEHFKVMIGGHGWSSDWKSLTYQATVDTARSQIKYNYGSTVNDLGRITKPA